MKRKKLAPVLPSKPIGGRMGLGEAAHAARVRARRLIGRLEEDLAQLESVEDPTSIVERVTDAYAAYAGVGRSMIDLMALSLTITANATCEGVGAADNLQTDDEARAKSALYTYQTETGRPVVGAPMALWVEAIRTYRVRMVRSGRKKVKAEVGRAAAHIEALCALASALGLEPAAPQTVGQERSRNRRRLNRLA